MKRIFSLGLCVIIVLCAGCRSSENTDLGRPVILEADPVEGSAYAEDYFLSTLRFDTQKGYIYPDTFGGMYAEGDKLIFQVAAEDFTEYQYLQDKYPNVVFQQVEYSKNYLQGLIDEYLTTYDKNTETVYMAYVDDILNRAVIGVDKETLSCKGPNEGSPLIFKSGSAITVS